MSFTSWLIKKLEGEKMSDLIYTLSIAVTPSVVAADGASQATVTGNIVDVNGVAVAGQVISFSTDIGTLSAVSGITDATGSVSVSLVSSVIGEATVNASASSAATATASVVFGAPNSAPEVLSDTAAVVTDVAAVATDTDKLKDALTAAGHDVEGFWSVVVAFGTKADQDVIAGIKKALTYLESEAVSVFDEAVALAKLK